MNKRAIIVGLVGLNLLLLGGLILTAYELPKANAQGIGRGGQYLAVSGAIESGLDALYVLNLDRSEVSVFLMNKAGQGNRPQIVDRRPGPDLISNLRGVPGGPERGGQRPRGR
jgi:hypothetical protein